MATYRPFICTRFENIIVISLEMAYNTKMKNIFNESPQIMVKQIKEMFEIIIDWETANKYQLYNSSNEKVGFAAEKTYGIFHRILRNIMRSHRTIHIDIWDKDNNHVLTGHRPWYFFFSDLNVTDNHNLLLGDIKTRFGFLKRKYDLCDRNGSVFATIESYRWRLWTFTVFDKMGKEVGVISKKWGGLVKEVFTDSDQFTVDYSKFPWTDEQKAILLFACLSIDLDFFEDNSGYALDLISG